MSHLITAHEAQQRLAAGARLIDIRERDEFAREHVPGSLNIPRAGLSAARLPDSPLIFTCRSGARTAACVADIDRVAGPDAAILDGGLQSWRAAGGAIAADRSAPIEIMRQVQIAAGSLILLGLLLAHLLHPGWLLLSAFVGCGLMFAGLSGWCGMAKLLVLMPWNRRAA